MRYAVHKNGDPLCIFGDPAYHHRPQLQGPFKGARLTQKEKDWNSAMSSVRVSVEWIFKDIINYFKFLDFKKNLKVQLSAVGKMYIVCTLLHNARCCLCGSTSSEYFDVLFILAYIFLWEIPDFLLVIHIILIKAKFSLAFIVRRHVEFQSFVILVRKVRAFCSVDTVQQNKFFIIYDT